MNDTVSRRALIGALGAGTLLPALAGVAHVAHGTFDALRVSVHAGNDFTELERCANALRRHL
jgi:hypothetical protein